MKKFLNNKYFIVSAGVLSLIFSILLSTQVVFAVPDECNFDPTVSRCCGRVLGCSFAIDGMDLWCESTQVPFGSPCL